MFTVYKAPKAPSVLPLLLLLLFLLIRFRDVVSGEQHLQLEMHKLPIPVKRGIL